MNEDTHKEKACKSKRNMHINITYIVAMLRVGVLVHPCISKRVLAHSLRGILLRSLVDAIGVAGVGLSSSLSDESPNAGLPLLQLSYLLHRRLFALGRRLGGFGVDLVDLAILGEDVKRFSFLNQGFKVAALHCSNFAALASHFLGGLLGRGGFWNLGESSGHQARVLLAQTLQCSHFVDSNCCRKVVEIFSGRIRSEKSTHEVRNHQNWQRDELVTVQELRKN